MNGLRKVGGVAVAALTAAAMAVLLARAQAPAGSAPTQAPGAPAVNRSVVVLDPAHGGPDGGAGLGDKVIEKDVTLALAAKLKASLTAAGFTVVSTRDADPTTVVGTDQRAEIANRAHAVACVVLHATATGSGVHVYTSTLAAKDAPEADDAGDPAVFEPVPWDTAQASFVGQSVRLAGGVSAALGKANLPAVVGKAAVKPLDNLMCPAFAVEIAPLGAAGGDRVAVTDAAYQQRVVAAVVQAMQAWRGSSGVAK